ncbi:MAG: polysaccharide deacetylase family protein [Elusimicrobia bacterium]|nr:polysaccharide deacetylase family protein [Elusimicrobiota bacterium]
MALTFDDGPHPFYTKKILEILTKYNATATFFLVGTQVRKYPELVKAIFAQGSEVGNHTYHHKRLIYLSDEEIKDEIEKNTTLLEKISRKKIKYLRPPGGRYYFKSLKGISNTTDLEVILWTINTDDIVQTSSQIWRKVKMASDGDIILMHSGVPQTIRTLPKMLEFFRKKGIHPVSVTRFKEEMARREFNSECGQVLR